MFSQPEGAARNALEIASGVYAVCGLGHPRLVTVNAGFVITPSALIFIDAGMSMADGEFLLESACRLAPSRQTVALVLTHHHSDHSFGMRVFCERGAQVYAHARVREFFEVDRGAYRSFIIEKYLGGDMEAGNQILGAVELYLPGHLLEADTLLDFDGEKIQLLCTPGHTASSICAYLPGCKVLFAGDSVYAGMPPNTAFADAAGRAEWVRQLRRLQALDIEQIVPGHGGLCGKDEIQRNIAWLEKGSESKSYHE